MRRTFLAKRNALLTTKGVSWGIFLILLVCSLLFLRVLAPNAFWKLFTPVFGVSHIFSTKTDAFFDGFRDTAALAQENAQLEDENHALASQNQMLTQKLKNVTALLSVHETKETIPGLLAGVIARPPESPYDVLVIAAGEEDGVIVGMEAFGERNTPIGIVTSVLKNVSYVTLFSTSGVATEGWVGNTNTPITITGVGGGVMEASTVRDANVSVGDAVFVPGPGMLPVGSVVRLDSDPLSPQVKLRIRPAANFYGLSWIVVRATGAVPTVFATSTLPL